MHSDHMNLILVPHNLTLTKAIEDHLISRIDKLDHLNQYATNVRVTLDHDQTKAPERQFHAPCGLRFRDRTFLLKTSKAICMRRLMLWRKKSSSSFASGTTRERHASIRSRRDKRRRQEAAI